jgi:hypothetical protein
LGKNYFVGVDIGGTKVAAGLVDANGEISSQVREPMISNSFAEEGLNAVLSAIARVIPEDAADVGGIGICAPGPLDPKTGVILNPPNLPCWRNFPLAEFVQRQYSASVRVDNDANAAALAETRWGAARGCRNVFNATIGTGIGTGIVFDGKIYHGRTGSAGEGGHVSIDYQGPICRCEFRTSPSIRALTKFRFSQAATVRIPALPAARHCACDLRNFIFCSPRLTNDSQVFSPGYPTGFCILECRGFFSRQQHRGFSRKRISGGRFRARPGFSSASLAGSAFRVG